MSSSLSLFSKLPFDLIREILLYDTHFVLRNSTYKKRIVFIDKIPKDDYRFFLYGNVPRVYQQADNRWTAILESKTHKKRYVLSHYLRPSLIWEYSFVVYSKDQHTSMMCTIPDSMIYVPLYNSDFGL
uniref:Uncharacterized protein n=1 Tax=viral metagenome TaxID=1070528 RepID=A0A6C0IDP7_9ZZZZ